jgi:SAM-dependent methyltransferase
MRSGGKSAVRTLQGLVSKAIRTRLREAPGIRRLFSTTMVQRLLGRTEIQDPDRTCTEEGREQSQTRWLRARPNPDLTWGQELTGEAFVSKVESYASFGNETMVLEIGPGYGRILRSFLARGIPFKEYYGLDISKQNVEHLHKQFPQPNVHFIHADVEGASMPYQFDVAFSSLTFKHLYPSFEKALHNVSRYMSSGGLIIFDLIEGIYTYFSHRDHTYLRQYRREEILDIIEKVKLEHVAFDEVIHDPEHLRLLVVAAKPDHRP